MTLILTEGFELPLFPVPTGNQNRWSGSNFFLTASSPRTGVYAGYTTGGSFATHQVQPADEHATFIVGFGLIPSNVGDIIRFMSDNVVTEHVVLRWVTGGALAIDRGSTQLAITPGNTCPLNVWTYIEIKVTLHDSTGTIEVRINGGTTPILTFTGDTKNGGTKTVIDSITIQSNNGHIDDIYIANGAGAVHNNFLGEIKCLAIYPVGNGTYSQLVGSDGNSVDNYLLVDDSGASADYVGSGTDGQKDTYAMTDVANVASVVNIYTIHWVIKSDSGPRAFRPVIRTNGSDHPGPDYGSISTMQLSYLTQFNLNPITGNPWTSAELNALELGFEVRPG